MKLNEEAKKRIKELEKEIQNIKSGKERCFFCGEYHRESCPLFKGSLKGEDKWYNNF